ncbi:hypothetical protein B484DRAFT_53905 [Ochromonadaceae sp. CCMP2298]|nr:hypothetical protein B484DRAFT_53905 [Ochromonadaceae sp. CCMP2298]
MCKYRYFNIDTGFYAAPLPPPSPLSAPSTVSTLHPLSVLDVGVGGRVLQRAALPRRRRLQGLNRSITTRGAGGWTINTTSSSSESSSPNSTGVRMICGIEAWQQGKAERCRLARVGDQAQPGHKGAPADCPPVQCCPHTLSHVPGHQLPQL